MKLIIVMGLLSLSAWAGLGKEAWESSNLEGKVRLLRALEDFYAEASKQGLVDEKRTTFLQLIPQAWASVAGMDCVYAGWPSKRTDGRCGNPVTQNPGYSAGECGGGQMQCQPLLFGPNLCAPVATSSDRSMAFSNCRSRFRASGRNHRGVVETLIRDRKGADLTELLDFAERICREGAQASTPMCRRLQEVVTEVRAAMGGLDTAVDALLNAGAVIGDGVGGPVNCPPTGGPVLQGGVSPGFVPVPVDVAPPIASVPPYQPQDLSLAPARVDACAALAVGESKVVGEAADSFLRDPANALTHGRAAMGINPSYTLSRTGQGNYVATLALNFSGHQSEAMRQRAVNCMRQVSPSLRGPNGESLEVRIISPGAADLPGNLQPRALNVQVMEGDGRGDAQTYYQNFDCTTISHEMMHMLGLVDEYDEKEMSAAHDPKCRIVTAPGRINLMSDMRAAHEVSRPAVVSCGCGPECQALMRHPDPAVRDYFLAPRLRDIVTESIAGSFCRQGTFTEVGEWDAMTQRPAPTSVQDAPGGFRVEEHLVVKRGNRFVLKKSTTRCECTVNDAASCGFALETAEQKLRSGQGVHNTTCPSGSTPRGEEDNNRSTQNFALTGEGDNASFSFVRAGTGLSLLEANQFARILAGQCGRGAETYNRCAQFANAIHNERGAPIDCQKDVPSECRDPNYYLGARAPASAGPILPPTRGVPQRPAPPATPQVEPPTPRSGQREERAPPEREVAGPRRGGLMFTPTPYQTFEDTPKSFPGNGVVYSREQRMAFLLRQPPETAGVLQPPATIPATIPFRRFEFYGDATSVGDSQLRLEEVALAYTDDQPPVLTIRETANWKSVLVFIPRTTTPRQEVVGDEMRVTLATGEEVVFDRRTGTTLRGALREGPIDTNTNRHARGVPSVTYQGTGISIRVDHRYELATGPEGDATATVTQGNRTCNVPRARIYDDIGNIRTLSDAELVGVFNQVCPARRGQQPFRLP